MFGAVEGPSPRAAGPGRRHLLIAAILLASVAGAACGPTQTASPVQPGASGGQSAPPPPSGLPSPSSSAQTNGLRPNPNAPSYALLDPRAPARLPGTIHDVELAVMERYMTVASGFVQEVWTIAGAAPPLGLGTVPGPVIRVRAGDTVRVHLVNAPPKGTYPTMHPAVNDYPHALQFDGSTGASEAQTTPLQRAEERTFEFTTDSAGVWLYHGSTEPLIQNLVNGLYGMLIVEPRGGPDSVDREFAFVQGEWYIGGPYPYVFSLPSLDKAMAEDPTPDFVVLNGVADQYRDNPIQITAGERIRAFLLNAGPNLHMSFRIEGVAFDRVIRQGVELPGSGAESVDLAPGQGAIVEFTIPQDGQYPFLTSVSPTAPGAEGLFQAVEGRG
jgi:nitrite reductase (NO-forming)